MKIDSKTSSRDCKFNLWDELKDNKKINHTPDDLFFAHRHEIHKKLVSKYSNLPKTKQLLRSMSMFDRIKSSLVIGQEFCICTLLFCFHRILIVHSFDYDENEAQQLQHHESINITLLLIIITTILFCIIIYSEEKNNKQYHQENKAIMNFIQKKYEKLKTRVTDAFLLAIILRLCSSIPHTLTASYSSDTIFALCFLSIFIHMLPCDYDYANGLMNKKTIQQSNKSTYLGGSTIISLNASLFATILLSSRLRTNMDTFVFVSSSIVAFVFYPAARHTISKKTLSLYHFQCEFLSLVHQHFLTSSYILEHKYHRQYSYLF